MNTKSTTIMSFLLSASTAVMGFPACHLRAATPIPLNTTYNVGPNLAGAITNIPGLGQALLDGINVWNVSGYYTNGRLIAPGTISASDCPDGLSLQVGVYSFEASTCQAAIKTGVTGSYDLDDLFIPLGFVDYYHNPNCQNCTTLGTKSISLNLNVLWSLGAEPGKRDVQSVMAHEAGHALGIAHGENNVCPDYAPSYFSYTPSCAALAAYPPSSPDFPGYPPPPGVDPNRPTMGNFIYPGETCVRTLSAHDIQSATTPLPP